MILFWGMAIKSKKPSLFLNFTGLRGHPLRHFLDMFHCFTFRVTIHCRWDIMLGRCFVASNVSAHPAVEDAMGRYYFATEPLPCFLTCYNFSMPSFEEIWGWWSFNSYSIFGHEEPFPPLFSIAVYWWRSDVILRLKGCLKIFRRLMEPETSLVTWMSQEVSKWLVNGL